MPDKLTPAAIAQMSTSLAQNNARAIEVQALRYIDIPKATRTRYRACLISGYEQYYADADNAPMPKFRGMLRIAAVLADNVFAQKAICINRGEATVAIGLGRRRRGPVGKIVLAILDRFGSEEVNKRKQEFVAKLDQMLDVAFGEKVSDMLEICGLATDPRKQGKGYGKALVQFINAVSDAQGRAVYAVTSDAQGFYESLGYTLASEDFIGAGNPTRNGPPVAIRVDADTAPGSVVRQRFALTINYLDNVHCHKAWTIDHGSSILTLGFPENREGPFLPIVAPLLKAFDTEELKKRKKEWVDATNMLLRETLGDAVKDMIEVQGLATAPEKQGRGYATALMRFVNALVLLSRLSPKADAQERSVYLFTTDAYGFYETVGYTVLQEAVIGVDNPKWNGDPIHIRIGDSQTTRSHVPDVVPLRYVEIFRAARCTQDAVADLASNHYLRDADTAPCSVARQRLSLTIHYLDSVYCRKAWAVDHGSSIVTLGFPGNKEGPFRPIVAPFLGAFVTEELKRRRREWANATKALLNDTLGDSAKDMIEVQGLVTAPEKQGRGYGTVLMRFVNALADAQNRGVYIFTTGAHGFYQSVGYSILQEAVVGVDNPRWNGDPVHIKIEAKSAYVNRKT
ncbi:hypothetical protein C8Q73DRAFT_787620 [Cubamyces lactineus]|nr:hypothetical protein C8Q73DRAFT_787620 [Cubamyces lactineus]